MSQASSSCLSFPQVHLCTLCWYECAINWKGEVVFNGFTSCKSHSATGQHYYCLHGYTYKHNKTDRTFCRKTNVIPLHYHLFIVKRTDLDSGGEKQNRCFTKEQEVASTGLSIPSVF